MEERALTFVYESSRGNSRDSEAEDNAKERRTTLSDFHLMYATVSWIYFNKNALSFTSAEIKEHTLSCKP